MSVPPLGATVPTRRTRMEVFAALLASFVLVIGLTGAALHQAPAADAANHDNYIANSSSSSTRIKAHIVSPYGSVYDVWVYPGSDTGKGRVLHPGTRGVWLPKNCKRWASRPGQPVAAGYNKVSGPGTFKVWACK